MRSRPETAITARITAGQSRFRGNGRRAVRSSVLLAGLPVVLALSACGGPTGEGTGEAAEEAALLHESQLLSFEGAEIMPEGSEAGVYSELVTVQYSEQVRASTEIDKPDCLDAANRWADAEAVQGAPASLTSYEWDRGSLTHLLVRLDEEGAASAVSSRPPADCATYTATYEDGTSSGYEVRDLSGLPALGDESRGFAVDVDTDGESNHMYSVMYRNGDLVGTTSIMGPGALEDYKEMLVEFTRASVERQQDKLG
ncbi:hypothetical protein SAMN05421803_10985 [Nocardiopsis flavescens]|uniref:PknH-like extracellular domain-containing protein n=1 Tax=Nocardiopsis flavescens TaxID=758803 RepID=A0A1M6LWG3_9ACTN|nr:hypothetical protein [Nocardiopsis flavescens]SHJ75501.1 hypothetical protein SAMN05421803_10985 [Nocardiopsis flavescens]